MTAFDTSRSNIVGKSEGKKLLIIVGSMIVVDIMLNDNPWEVPFCISLGVINEAGLGR